jgi:hypothetical protein
MTQPRRSEQRLVELKAELATIDRALPGTINIAMNRCGKPNCACHHEPPKLHGPYITWTRKVNGKTVTRRLSEQQLERYRPWFDNDRRLRALIKEIETLSLETLDTDQQPQTLGNPAPDPPTGSDHR